MDGASNLIPVSLPQEYIVQGTRARSEVDRIVRRVNRAEELSARHRRPHRAA